jgi:hypothetical protein
MIRFGILCVFGGFNAVFRGFMGNIPDTNMRPKCAIMCHYGAKFVHYGAFFVQCDAKFVPNETTDCSDFTDF